MDIKQFLVLLYDFIPNMKYVWNINRFLKTGKNLTTTLHSKSTKPEKVFDEKKTNKKVQKQQKHAYISSLLTMLKFGIFFTLNYNLKILNLQSKTSL